jgi:ribosomal protein L3 glutamine methyltransferase
MALPFTTVRDLLRFGVSRFTEAGLSFGHGSSNAYDEAAYLILHTLHLPLDTLDPFLDARLLDTEIDAVMKVIERRAKDRVPAAYITHEAWMHGHRFYVDERVIVPRSFIAELLADGEGTGILDAWLSDKTQRVLDLCTGNGSLAVIAALAYPEVTVDAADISDDALAVARINVDKHKLGKRISVQKSDLLADVRGPYDLIVCNPPYVNSASMQALPPEYRAEPALALDGGADGMDLVRTILRDAPAKMTPDAVLVLEIGNERRHFEQAFARLEVAWLETSAGHDQVLVVTREALSR